MAVKRWLCVLLLVVTGGLVACGSTTTAPTWFVRDYGGLPSALLPVQPGTQEADTVVWGASGQIDVVTFGSSGCPKLPIRLDPTAANAYTLTLSSGDPPSGESCTTDLAPTTSVIRVPSDVDPTRQVDVTIVDGAQRTRAVLPPRPSPA